MLRGQPLVLGQISVTGVLSKETVPSSACFGPDDDLEERGLSGAVDADDRGFVALFEMEGDVPQDDLFRGILCLCDDMPGSWIYSFMSVICVCFMRLFKLPDLSGITVLLMQPGGARYPS